MVVNTVGFYFVNDNLTTAVKNSVVSKAVKIIKNNNNSNHSNNSNYYKQYDITKSKLVGFYLSEAHDNNIIFRNNGNYWMKGESIRSCNVTTLDHGMLCKPYINETQYNNGDYCYSEKAKQLYLLTDSTTSESEKINCVYGTDTNPRYLMSEATHNLLNEVEVSKRIIELTNRSIALAPPAGCYLLNENGELVIKDEVDIVWNGETDQGQLFIYRCTANECIEQIPESNKRILSVTGKIYEYDEEKERLVKAINEGIYFFKEDGFVCASEEDAIVNILRIRKGNESETIIESISEADLEEDVYVNEANPNTVAVRQSKQWKIEIANCVYDDKTESCVNYKIDLGIGNYFIFEGELFMIKDILNAGTKYEMKKCIRGREENPIYFRKEKDSRLMKVKAKTIKFVKEEGYYALNPNSYEAIVSNEVTESEFIRCEHSGQCSVETPAIGYYLNRSPMNSTIIHYPHGNVQETLSMNNACLLKDGRSTNSKLKEGDPCLSSNSLYLISKDSQCVKVEDTVVSYPFIAHKLYRLTHDAIIQLLNDGIIERRERFGIQRTIEKKTP